MLHFTDQKTEAGYNYNQPKDTQFTTGETRIWTHINQLQGSMF